MQKLDQRIKELQALINNPEFNEIIREKLTDVWHDTENEAYREMNERQKEYERRLNASLTPEEKKRMDNSHLWRFIDSHSEEEGCAICFIDQFTYWHCPQYCEPKVNSEKPKKV